MIRVTTNSVLKGYKANLMRSSNTLNHARNTVLTQRNFNSYAEDPAAATQAFKLRRSFWRVSSQVDNSNAVINKFNTAYSALDKISEIVATAEGDISTAYGSAGEGANDPTAAGRSALGQQMMQTAESIVQGMNAKYGDSFVFAGTDGLKVPFSWDDGKICFRGIPVDTNDPDEKALLDQYAGEVLNVDLGLGLQESEDGVIKGSAFDAALSGLDFLGYGVDEDGLPNNLASVINELGQCLSRCDPDTGKWADGDLERYEKLQVKLKDGMNNLTVTRTEQSASATFLKTNLDQLKDTAYTLNEQIESIEKCDLADAITSFSWAQYCYNAALKVGNSILSQSLIDYMN